jgi:hypothetical protein
MSQERWEAYVRYRLTRVRAQIQETERLICPRTPEELVLLQKRLQRLKEREAQLAALLTAEPPLGLFDP